MKQVEIKPQKFGVFTKISRLMEKERPDIVEYELQNLVRKMEKHLEENNLTLISKPNIVDDPFYISYYCTKENCEFQGNTDKCLEHHPEFVRLTSPCHLIGLIWRAIPKKYAKYAEDFKKARTVVIMEK